MNTFLNFAGIRFNLSAREVIRTSTLRNAFTILLQNYQLVVEWKILLPTSLSFVLGLRVEEHKSGTLQIFRVSESPYANATEFWKPHPSSTTYVRYCRACSRFTTPLRAPRNCDQLTKILFAHHLLHFQTLHQPRLVHITVRHRPVQSWTHLDRFFLLSNRTAWCYLNHFSSFI